MKDRDFGAGTQHEVGEGKPVRLDLRMLHDHVDCAREPKAVCWALAQFARSIRLDYFAFICLDDAGFTYLGNFPDHWKAYYVANDFIAVDPVVQEAKRQAGLFFWSARDWLSRPKCKDRSFARSAIASGLCQGLAVATKASFDRQLVLSFAGTEAQYARRFSSDSHEAVSVLMSLYHRMNFQLERHVSGQSIKLSPRELLCLTWAAKGKTASETAIITMLSERTVQHYLDAARLKLGADTIAHLVAISKDVKLI